MLSNCSAHASLCGAQGNGSPSNEWLAWQQQEENLQPFVLLELLVYLPQGLMRIALVILLEKWQCTIWLCIINIVYAIDRILKGISIYKWTQGGWGNKKQASLF